MVPRFSRDTICISCKQKKRKCSVRGLVNKLVAAGELGTIEDSMNLNISSREDVIGLGLERGMEVILLQILSLQQSVDERLMAIEGKLRTLEKGKGRAREEADDDDDENEGNSGSDLYEDSDG